MIGNILKKLKTRKFSEEFGLASDPRVVVVSRIEDFARMQDDENILAVTMPSPVSFPTKQVEIEAVLEATKGRFFVEQPVTHEMLLPRDQEINQELPACIKDTAHLLREAFKYAEGFGRLPNCYVRRNSEFPNARHTHKHEEVTGCADIFGSTTVFYKGTLMWPGPRYSLPSHHITILRGDIVHKAGDLSFKDPRLTMVCFIPKLDV